MDTTMRSAMFAALAAALLASGTLASGTLASGGGDGAAARELDRALRELRSLRERNHEQMQALRERRRELAARLGSEREQTQRLREGVEELRRARGELEGEIVSLRADLGEAGERTALLEGALARAAAEFPASGSGSPSPDEPLSLRVRRLLARVDVALARDCGSEASLTEIETPAGRRLVRLLRVGRVLKGWLSPDFVEAGIRIGQGGGGAWRVGLPEGWRRALRRALAILAGGDSPRVLTLPLVEPARVQRRGS